MKLARRKFLHLAAGAIALPAVPPIARAQTYPTRPVRIIVGFAAGGPADILARLIGQWMSERLGQPFVVENRPGAGGNIGTEVVVRAAPDGYTLLMGTVTNAINAALYDKLNFNFIHDIAPVASVARAASVMAVNPAVPATTVPEFIAYVKANPAKLNMASGGIGSLSHMSGALLKMLSSTDMVDIPSRGGEAGALVDVLGGHAQVLFATTLGSIEYIRAGKLRALAVTTVARSDTLPEVPTVGEFVRGFETSAWYGVGVPRNTPAGIVDRLNREINAGLADSKIKAKFADLGASALALSPADFGNLIAEDTEKWSRVIRAANIKPQ